MQRARTNNSEKHGKQNEKGEAQKKQHQHAKNNGSNGGSEQGRMWRKRQKEGTTYNEKDENNGRVTQGKQNNVEE